MEETVACLLAAKWAFQEIRKNVGKDQKQYVDEIIDALDYACGHLLLESIVRKSKDAEEDEED